MDCKNECPYNKANILLTCKNVESILFRYNIKIKVKDLAIYQRAFVNDSYVISTYNQEALEKYKDNLTTGIVPLQELSSQVEEFVGDCVVKLIIAEYLQDRYNDEKIHTEGFLTPLKSRLEDTYSLATFARLLNLGYYMLISKQIEDNNGRESEKLLEDTFEAFMYALYKDQGFEICRTFLRKLLETEVDYSDILSEDINYIKRLQNFYHSNKWGHPEYRDIESEKVNNKNYYTVCVLDFEGNLISSTLSTAKNKKLAKQEASKLALKHFGLI